ncbi:MAG TPA: dTMP kinase [Pseudonocardiaceae bacterium]|nr:dTMP kinase [Pseudonocardiaceae bacterium]
MIRSGFFVSIDGPSGVGKTSVSALLTKKLTSLGQRVVLTATPSTAELGKLARHGTYDYQAETLTCLVAADRYHHDRTTVGPAMSTGATVVCDRYVPSSLVLDPLDGVDSGFVMDLYRRITVPDIAFILVGEPILCVQRAAERGRYSRLQPADNDGGRRELQSFEAVAELLQRTGYPAQVHDIGAESAEQVADALAGVILAKEGERL